MPLMDFMRSLHLTFLLTILALSLLFAAATLYGGEEDWDERHSKWLLALTYPASEENPEEFGKETGEYERGLLERFKPRVVVSPEGLVPVDFYEFYLPRTVVRDESRKGVVVKEAPSREYLKSIERDRRYYLDYTGPLYPCEGDCKEYIATGYGRAYREAADLRTGEGRREIPIIVLKYTFPFPFSGLPAGLSLMREALMRVVADPVRFHELDIHGAVQIILDERERPIVLLLAQHNHFRTYLIGKDLPWPDDNHIPICFAERSNEPYPCHADTPPRYYRTVGNPKDFGYVIDGKSSALTAGEDRVYGQNGGGREVPYRLKFLPDRDPLYVSWIPLGDRKKILTFNTFYRNGPPGIDLNTSPELKAYGEIMQFWYLRDGNNEDAALMRNSFRSFSDVDFEKVLTRNGTRLYRDLVDIGYIE
ncbi:MAG: hypothetical protein GQ522_02885 [Deltaproteobacteria bacterium]|nr:hypothetical protein [Deltaproteobacteria bacterium]